MSSRKSVLLHNAQQGAVPFVELKEWCKAMLMAGHKLTVTAKVATRSDEANRLLHATLADVSRQIEWAGQKRSVDVWKRLLTAAWLRARGEPLEILPAVDGHGVDVVFQRTSELTRAECSELQEYITAWGIEHGVKFSAPDA